MLSGLLPTYVPIESRGRNITHRRAHLGQPVGLRGAVLSRDRAAAKHCAAEPVSTPVPAAPLRERSDRQQALAGARASASPSIVYT